MNIPPELEAEMIAKGATVTKKPVQVPIELPQDKPLSEKRFMALVLLLAKRNGWLVYHTHRSDRSEPGFPDLTLVRPPRVIFAELKTDKGKVSEEQQEWISALKDCPGVEVAVWRPQYWQQITLSLEKP